MSIERIAELEIEAGKLSCENISLQDRIAELETALQFYADPDTWFATMTIGDPPHGEILSDYSMIEEEGCHRLGMRAREALREKD